MKALMLKTQYLGFKDLHLGGALISCDLLEKVQSHYNSSNVFQIYGSSEVEPVCLIDAKTSVEESRKRHFISFSFSG